MKAILVDMGNTLVEQKVDDVLPLSKLGLKAFPDAVPALDEWKRRGLRLAIVSNTSQSDSAEVEKALDELGLSRFFDAIVTSVDVGHEKPHPSMFEAALHLLNCSPADAAMIGDDLIKDIGGAADLGLTTIHVDRHRSAAGRSPVTADYTVDTLLDVIDALDP